MSNVNLRGKRVLSVKADDVLDCLGLYCPVPISETAKKIKSLDVGQVLEVLSDDEGIKMDMPAWCKATGNELLSLEEDNGTFKVYVRRLR
ncbi:MAG: sulfurtransferase TusA family protein [Chloroflexi bacterium]|nr:sulfurtransferase TusA family protein [Chloroflexota bacterium]